MLSDLTPTATLASADIQRARKFYEDALGLKELTDNRLADDAGGVFYRCGDGAVFVYESPYAGTNKATALTFSATEEQFDATVAFLRQKGVTFMTFDFEGIEWKGDIAHMGGFRSVWFADPDGNILNMGTTG
jgi:catechol 2,3-dioxygenase-like lactoylglutathione lyase family enzyme